MAERGVRGEREIKRGRERSERGEGDKAWQREE